MNCPICGQPAKQDAKRRVRETCGRSICVSALRRRNALAQGFGPRMPAPDCGTWIGLAFYFDQPHAFDRPREDGVIQDTPTDSFSFSAIA
jgi:hypothetical protein